MFVSKVVGAERARTTLRTTFSEALVLKIYNLITVYDLIDDLLHVMNYQDDVGARMKVYDEYGVWDTAGNRQPPQIFEGYVLGRCDLSLYNPENQELLG